MDTVKKFFGRGSANAEEAQPDKSRNITDTGATVVVDMPEETMGLHVLYDTATEGLSPEVDVVAVHGLNGDAFETWTEKSSGCLWLRDLLPKMDGFQTARVMTYGYDARAFLKPWQKTKTGRTYTFAEDLVGDLSDARASPESKLRPIIFIGHFLGGIVIKAALLHAKARESLYGYILNSTKSLVFFGTPHQGSDTATWASYLGLIGKSVRVRHTPVMEELQQWSKLLVEQTTLFSEIAPNVTITTFYENQSTMGGTVVNEGSARMGQKNERIAELDADHHEICKLTPETRNYRRVKGRFESIRQKITSQNPAVRLAAVAVAPSHEPASLEAEIRDDDELHQRLKSLR